MKKATRSDESSDDQASGIEDLARIFSLIAEAPADRRDALLNELCPSDSVKRQIQSMLEADATADSLLDHSLIPEPVRVDSGETIAGYTLLHELGHGGMGVVFQAEQLEPLRRTVALKVIKPGVDTREVISRFDVERQALSMMDHPNIAKVLDAGSTESGRPYFVMELVKGQPITTYCQQNHLTPHERLRLFLSVCNAIQHAHQKGIIHRDIKPSNVLVAEYDGRPVAKVIDFGVAKAMDQSLTEATAFTRAGQIVGTFEYMSPEQSRINQSDVDTRSDIYSLGVLLYELLTGSPPFDKDRLRSVAWDEMLKIIRSEEPPRPSARLSESNVDGTVNRTDRHGPNHIKGVRGELDWVVMKAMEKDRSRRYATPNDLGNDIERFLNGEAVAACPPSPLYRFRKFAQRNRVALVTSAIVAASLIFGMISTTWYAVRATRAEADSTELSEFLGDRLFSLAGSESAAGFSSDPNVRMLILLKNASDELDKRFPDRPEIRANLKATLARSLQVIDEHEEATRLYNEYWDYLKATEGPKHPDTILAATQLVENYVDDGRLDDAESLCVETLGHSRELGEGHELSLCLLDNLGMILHKQGLYDKAMATHAKCLSIKRRSQQDDHPDVLLTKSNLALVYESKRNFEAAEALYKEVLLASESNSSSPKDLRVAQAQGNLGKCYLKYGRHALGGDQPSRTLAREKFNRAVKLLEPSHFLFREIRGRYDRQTVDLQLKLAATYNEIGRHDSAEPLLVTLVERLDNSDTIKPHAMNMLGWTFLRQSRFPEAERTLTEAFELLRIEHPTDRRTIQVMGNLAIVLNRMGKLEDSIAMDEQTSKLAAEVLGPDHIETLAARTRLGLGRLEQGRSDQGRVLLKQVFESSKRTPAATLIAKALAESYIADGNDDEAQFWTDAQTRAK